MLKGRVVAHVRTYCLVRKKVLKKEETSRHWSTGV
jgi:hypothetical protein